jgi:hypothetical protein
MLNKKLTILAALIMIMVLAACEPAPELVPVEGTELCIGPGLDAASAGLRLCGRWAA